MFQLIARHLLHTLNIIVVESFTTPHHYCPMSVQPLPALTVTVQVGKLYPKYANCGARQPSSAAAPRVIFYSVSESVIVNCASSNAASVMLCSLWIVCSASGRISASISGSAIEGIGIKAKEYKEPLFSIKRGISS